MAKKTSKKSTKVAKKIAAKPAAAKRAKPRKTAPKSQAAKGAKRVKLLSGGNPQIAKAYGDAPVQAYIAAMPGWKCDVGRRLDEIIERTVPNVYKAVKWNTPFYGFEGEGWFLGFHCFNKYIKVSFFRGTSLRPIPPGLSKQKEVRYLDIHEDELDEAQLAAWVKQASQLPCEKCELYFLWSGMVSIYKRHDVLPEWEPIPWNAYGPQVDEQEKGFHQRAQKALVWTKVDWNNFPENGIFGRDRNWFVSHDIAYVTTFDDEDLILIRNVWFGFPDPPEWGLASRPAGNAEASWEMWGHFPDLPATWQVRDAD